MNETPMDLGRMHAIASIQYAIEVLIKERDKLIDGGTPEWHAAQRPFVTIENLDRPRRTMSEEGRARIAAAQRKRWAKARKGTDHSSNAKGYWNKLTPEERSKEMRRRMKKRKEG